MKYLTILLTIISITLIGIGGYYDFLGVNEELKNKFYGYGSLCLFFLAMPCFLISRRNKTNIKKYILDLDSLKKKESPKRD